MTFEHGRTCDQLRGDINVTPLIDVLLVLLIIFMVITPVVPHGLDAALPRSPAKPSARTGTPVVVEIASTRNGLLSYRINQDDVRIDELGRRLSSIFSVRADKMMFVEGEDDLDFSTIAKVMDIGKSAGADHIGLITSKSRL